MSDTPNTPGPNSELKAALPLLMQAAEEGNAAAQFRLGMLFANGEGVELNYVRGAEWIRRAAEQGHAEAMRSLAWLHANGFGVEQSNEAAREWLLKAAESGDAAAQCTVAAMYQLGRYDAKKDAKKMLDWYQRAAEQGHPTAQFALGKLMAAGDTVEQNDEAAFQWLTLAIMNGNEPARKELSMLTARLDSTTLEAYKTRMQEAVAQGSRIH